MARPIAYNTSHPLSGSITSTQGGGTISYTIDGKDRDYTSFASKKWVPSADGAGPIIFVTDSFTQGITNAANSVPLFYACAGTSSAAIVYTANRLPGSSGNYTTAEEAVTDLLSNDWFIIEGEQPFEGVDADKMVLDLDASKRISYPKTQSAWYDISGKNNASSLTNGPTFNSGGWFEFDGIDDYSVGPGGLGQDCTVELWISSSNYDGTIPLSINGNGYSSGPNIYCTSNVITWNTGDGAGNPFANSSYPDTKWHHIVVSNDFTGNAGFNQAALYIDGDFIGFATPLNATTTQGGSKFWIGRFHGGGYFTSGKFKAVRIYDEAFTEARIKQNYFGSNRVIDSLAFYFDPNNIVSYDKSSTRAYSLTGSNVGDLQNGVGYDQRNGGSWYFDGVDDQIFYGYQAINFNPSTSDFSMGGWINLASSAGSGNQAVLLDIGGTGTSRLYIAIHKTNMRFEVNTRVPAGSVIVPLFTSNNSVSYNTWYYVVFTKEGSNLKLYVNGQLEDTSTDTSGIDTQTYNWYSGLQDDNNNRMNGRIGPVELYSKALSSEEVLQNYQAEQYKFKESLGIVTGSLSLHLDASNTSSYPGSGTTWFDLSGNSNNVSLVNGPSFNTVNGFSYFNFDGSNDYGTTGNVLVNTAQYAIFLVFRPLNVSTVRGGFAGQNDFIEYGVYNSGAQGHRYYTNGPGALDGNIEMYTNNTWYIACLTNTPSYDGAADRQVYFLNGGEIVNKSYAATVGSQTYNFNIAGNGIWDPLGNFMNIDIAALLVYGRGLDKPEVLQNYNYLKSLYGLNV